MTSFFGTSGVGCAYLLCLIPSVMCYGYRSLIERYLQTIDLLCYLRPSAARWSSGFRIESAGWPL